MKILGIVLAVLLAIIALLGAGLQMFLTKGLTSALNQRVFPAVQSMYGLEMSITNASVNLLKGSAELGGLTVRNLKGYEEPYLLTFDKCRLEVELLSLFKRNPVIIKLAEAHGATLVVERNKEQKFNVKELAASLKPPSGTPAESAPPAETGAPQQTPPAEQPVPANAKPIPVHIRRIAIDALVKYSDTKRNEKYGMNLRLTGSDLFTVPAAGQPDSLIVLRGALADDKEAFATDLNAILSPLTDPENPTFNATGSIQGINKKFLDDLLKKNDMKCDAFSVKPAIICKQGQLKGSRIDLVLSNFKIYGTDAGEVTLKLPLSGTLKNPVLDLTHALQTLFSEQSVKIGKAVGLKKLRKELGAGSNATPQGMLVSGLTNNVKEIAESPALQQLIGQVAPGSQPTNSTTTNQPSAKSSSDVLIEQLGKSVKDLEDNKEVKDSLKSLGNSLFGK